MGGLLEDVRYGWRRLRQSPSFAAVAIMILALGIGANTAIFSLIDALMLRLLPVPHPEQLVILEWRANSQSSHSEETSGSCPDLGNKAAGVTSCVFSYPAFERLRDNQKVLAGIFGTFWASGLDVTVNGETRQADGDFVTGDYFSTLHIQTALGRALQPADDVTGVPPAIELSYAYWQRRFAGDRSIVGKTIYINRVPFTVAGAASPGFSGLDAGLPRDFWVPLSSRYLLDEHFDKSKQTNPNYLWLDVGGRLKPGVSIAQAQSELSAIFAASATSGSVPLVKLADKPQIELADGSRGFTTLGGFFAPYFFVLMAFVGLILLITCANLAGLMLARGAARQKEIAVRFAMGARRKRIIRQLLTESLMLALAGGSLGALIGYWGANSVSAFLSYLVANLGLTFELEAHPDLRVLGFTLAVSCLVGVLFGLAPAFRSTGISPIPVLKEAGTGLAGEAGGRGRHWLGKSLVVTQVALCVVALVVAGLLLHTLVNLKTLEIGFDPKNVLLFDLDPTLTGFKGAKFQNVRRELQTKLAAIPGVISASYSDRTLLSMSESSSVMGRPNVSDKQNIQVSTLSIGPGFLETMRIPLLAGRTFTAQDFVIPKEQPAVNNKENLKSQSTSKPAENRKRLRPIVVNRTFARRFFGNENALGGLIGSGRAPAPADYEIIGVVADAKYNSQRSEIISTAYFPIEDDGNWFEVRTAMPPEALIPAVREAIRSVNGNLIMLNPRTQVDQDENTLFLERLLADLSNLFGLLALSLAVIGLYGLLSYEVTRRTHEIGVRLAVGALPADVQKQVIRQGMELVVIGLILGALASLGLGRVLTTLLYGVRPTDPITFVAVAGILATVALLANSIPARRAAKVDPVVALRYE